MDQGKQPRTGKKTSLIF